MSTARWTVATATGVCALAAFGAAAAPAGALTPARTAWWNEAPLGLVLTASPPQSDQLVVGEGTTGADAVAAVDYSVPPGATGGQALLSVSATMTLPLDSGSSVGTPSVMACPVDPKAAGWRAGGNQSGAPPAYDCSAGKGVTGQLSPDGSSMAFSLGPAQQETGSPGVFNLALVPVGQTPFHTVIDPPAGSDFAVAQPPPPPAAPAGASGAPAPAGGGSGAPADSSNQGSAGGSGDFVSGSSPDLSSGGLAGSAALAAPTAPSLPSGAPTGAAPSASSAMAPGRAPRVAAGPLGRTAANSSASAGSGGLFGGRRQKLLGVWLLVDAGLVLYLFGSELERAPRLLGSVAARRVRPTESALAVASAGAEGSRGTGAPVAAAEGRGEGSEVRGIGRFARPRSDPPRRLY